MHSVLCKTKAFFNPCANASDIIEYHRALPRYLEVNYATYN